ncbi:MAG: response regulator transcription factor [Acidobacteriota bacterium]|nr:response regulator transcription factor [Acidobacteriota bacterium]
MSILAESPARERAIAELLAEDERIEIVNLRKNPADVLVAAGARPELLSDERTSIVFLTDNEPVAFGEPGRAWLPAIVSAAELIAAVRAAAEDLMVLTTAQARRHLPGKSQPTARAALVEPLTKRESQVLRMLANGLGNKEIAGQLGISDHTAKFHVAQILAKLGAGSRTEAVTVAIRRGLVPI